VSLDFSEIRRLVIVAMFSDEQLLGRLVLKGGNALELIHRVLTRGSVDVDLSIADEFRDLDDTRQRIFRALRRAFWGAGYLVFDESFLAVPPDPTEDRADWWGGYKVEFKLIATARADALKRDLEQMRRQAATIDPRQGRKFRVEISKHEYCEGKMSAELDGRTIYVYTEEMCVVEKCRAICQQMPEYGRTHPTPRARDFYDIYTTVTRRGLDLALPENLDLFRHVFGAKRVPLALLSRIAETREFHRPDWAAVKDAAVGEVLAFDTYFDFVVDEVSKLDSLWEK
jgi:predicted nucleotidyltransferase component of viral defense system